MPGVTVTATSPALLSPSVAISDAVGNYRLINLPPGTYTLTAELAGFSVFRREGILLRAGANFQVDITMALGTLEETITVSGDSPMLEVSSPSNVLNIDADFQKTLPLVEGKYWSDFLHMTPGVMSRPHNDGSGRQNYFGNAVDHRDAVVDMEGMMASNYNDSNINRTALSTEAVEDVQIKTGGVDAASPMGYGLVLNMISKSGGNQFSGSGGWTFQPFEWNGDNTGGNGTPATRAINQADFSLGGPIMRDRVWFFGALPVAEQPDDAEPHSGRGCGPQSALPWRRVREHLAQESAAVREGDGAAADQPHAGRDLSGRPAAHAQRRADDDEVRRSAVDGRGAVRGQADVGRGGAVSRRPSPPATTTRGETASTATTGAPSRGRASTYTRPSRWRRAGPRGPACS